METLVPLQLSLLGNSLSQVIITLHNLDWMYSQVLVLQQIQTTYNQPRICRKLSPVIGVFTKTQLDDRNHCIHWYN